jgi:hypothetical protein
MSEGPLIATIEEQVEATTVGVLSLILLLLSQVGMVLTLSTVNGAIGAIQETGALRCDGAPIW